MLKSLIIVWLRIPKKYLVSLLLFVFAIVGERLFDFYFMDAKFLDWPKVKPVLIWSGIILGSYFFLAIIYCSLKTITELQTQIASSHQKLSEKQVVPLIDSKKTLPDRYISVGTFKTKELEVDIRAEIILEEQIKPDIENFLERIGTGNPYCPNCSRPLDEWKLDWMANFAQIGYKCPPCNTQREGDALDLLNDVYGLIRSNYAYYWNIYSEKIHQLTGGKPQDYIIK
jgi:hypothetical protein